MPERYVPYKDFSDPLDHAATAAVITEAAQHAASALRTSNGQAPLNFLLEDAGALGRAATGVPAVQRALRGRAVELLVLTPVSARDFASRWSDATRMLRRYHGTELAQRRGAHASNA